MRNLRGKKERTARGIKEEPPRSRARLQDLGSACVRNNRFSGDNSHEEQTCWSRPLKWAVCSALLSATHSRGGRAARDFTLMASRVLHHLAPECPSNHSSRPAIAVLHPSLAGAHRPHQVLVRLRGQSVAGSERPVTREQVLAEQAAFINRALARRAEHRSRRLACSSSLNAVVLDVDAADLPALARDTAITRVVGVSDYRARSLRNRAVHRRDTAHALGATRRGRPRRRHRQRHRLHARSARRSRHAGRYEAAWAPLPCRRRRPFRSCRRARATWSSTIPAPPRTTVCSRAPR